MINSRGEVSPRAESEYVRLQRLMLEGEDVRFNAEGRVSLAVAQWKPRGRRARTPD